MTYTLREVIASARWRHPAFNPVDHPDEACLALLNQFVRKARLAIVQRDARHLLSQQQIELPLASFTDGAVLPPYDLVDDVMAVAPSAAQPVGDVVAIIAASTRQDPTEWPACYLANDRIYLKGAEDDWNSYDYLLVNYVASYVVATSLDEDVALPDFAQAAVESWLAVQLAARSGLSKHERPLYDELKREAAECYADMLVQVTAQRGHEAWNTRERF